MNNAAKVAVIAVILAVGMVVSASMLSRFFIKIRHEQAISVKGYAEQDVVSDVGKFYCTCTAREAELTAAYDSLKKSCDAAVAYLKGKGFKDADVCVGNINTKKIMKRDSSGNWMNEIEYYELDQTITVTSGDVVLIRDVAGSITELIKDGIGIGASAPSFYISDLKDIKMGLLAKATSDGYKRALTLAENSKGNVGALISAQQGVFQITERNSTDISGYGEYDTSTIDKTAKVVVTLEYAIDAGK